MIYQQIINLLTIPPGNLVYHLVLAFSIAGTLPGALNLWQRAGLEEGKRLVIGLCLLLSAQFILIFNAGLAPLFPIYEAWLPILDRAINAFSLVIFIWLWVYLQPSRRADSATLLIALFIIFFAILTGLWWQSQTAYPYFNGSPVDLLWAGLSLLLTLAGSLLLIFRRPHGFGIGLATFSLLFLGQLIYLINPLPQGDFPGVVRLSQIAAYPLLLTLPARYSFAGELEGTLANGIHSEILQSLKTIVTSSEPSVVCQAVTKLVSYTLSADLCLLISPPDVNQHVSLQCGYNLSRRERIGTATFDSHLIPVLSEALRQGRPLHLPAKANIPDLAGFEKILNLPITGSLLSAPILRENGDIDKALVLLSPYSERSWTEMDQNSLADIAATLTDILEYKNKYLAQENQLAQSTITLQNIQEENDRLDNEIIDLTSRYNDAVKKKNQIKAELEKALKEIDSMKTSQSQEEG